MDTCDRIAPGDTSQPDVPGEPRRGFLGMAAAVFLAALAYVPPLIAGLCALVHPLRQKGKGGRFYRLARLENLPEDGTPHRVPVIADREDAWTRYAQEPIGAVFLMRTGNEVKAIHVVCPHAGCFVNYDAQQKKFFCPCHNASFDLSGRRLEANSPSPRDLDTLEVDTRRLPEVWVQFQNFRTGTSEKVPQA